MQELVSTLITFVMVILSVKMEVTNGPTTAQAPYAKTNSSAAYTRVGASIAVISVMEKMTVVICRV